MSEAYIPLSKYFEIQSGFAFPSNSFVDSGVPIVRMSDLKSGKLRFENTKYVGINWLKTSAAFSLKEGDFLVGMSGSLSNHATVTIDDLPALLNQRVGRLKQKSPGADYDYACYWLKSQGYTRYAEIQGEGAAQKNISAKQVCNFHYRNVPISTQSKIVSILKEIDLTIEKTEALIEKYQQIKVGLMHDLFTRGLTADGTLRPTREQAPDLYKQTPIGWIPKEWFLDNCANMFDIDSGITLGSHRRPKENARPYLRVANVYKEYLRLDDISFLEANNEENIRYGLKTHDLLLVEGHANVQQIGRCAIVDGNAEGMLFQNHLFRLRAKKTLPYFGMYLLNSNIARKYWETNCSTSSGLNTINRTMLGKMQFGVPSENEQKRIEERLACISNVISTERYFLAKLKARKQGLMHDLLTGKVPVTIEEPEAAHV